MLGGAPAIPTDRPTRRWWVRVFLIGLPTLVSLVVVSVDASRPFGYDESVTVGEFVKGGSLLHAATHQVVANNHQLVSSWGYLAYHLGVTSELGLRAFPALCVVATTALLAGWCLRRMETLPALFAALVFATSPLVVLNGRDLRGYGPLLFMATASTLLVAGFDKGAQGTRRIAAYLATAVLGVAAQLYMIPVLLLQTIYLSRSPDAGGRRLRALPLLGGLLGLAAGATLLSGILRNGRGRAFQPAFPADLAWGELGQAPVAVIVLGCLVATALWDARRDVRLQTQVVAVLGFAALVWVVGPTDLYPRFFVWLVPAVAVLAARGASRLSSGRASGRQIAVLLACAAALTSQVVTLVPRLTAAPLSNRTAAALLEQIDAEGGHSCVLSSSAEPLVGYYAPPAVPGSASMDGCDVVLALLPTTLDASILPAVRERFSHQVAVGGGTPAWIFTNASPGCVATPTPGCWVDPVSGS